MKNQTILVMAGLVAGYACLFSLLSLMKLGGFGDGDPINTPLRILNRDVALLPFVFLLIVRYLWKKEKNHNSRFLILNSKIYV
ncbi:MAG: hypothetical protein WC621_03500 [Patescibacteria group bacterium]